MRRTLCLVLLLAGCTQQPAPTPAADVAVKAPAERSAQTVMVGVADRAQACWFKTKDPRFARLNMAAEINSYAGRPRILLVPANSPAGLPKLVAQAETKGGRTRFESFGPLLDGKDGPELRASLDRWANGSKAC